MRREGIRGGIEARDGKVSAGTVESVILLSLSNRMTGQVKEMALHCTVQYSTAQGNASEVHQSIGRFSTVQYSTV